MTFDEFLRLKRNVLLGHYLVHQCHPDKFEMEVPYPPSEVSEDDLEALKDKLNECMPRKSIIVDLWDWDAHFEKELPGDWYFVAIFGDENSIQICAATLADYFHEQVNYFGMDYNQHEDENSFQEFVLRESVKFVRNWRDEAFSTTVS